MPGWKSKPLYVAMHRHCCTGSRHFRLFSKARTTVAQVLLWVGLPTGAILSVAAWLVEGERLMAYGFRVAASNPGIVASLGLASASVNLFSFLAIHLTSSLTFKTVGCMKNVFVVWMGVLMGDKVSGMQLVGMVEIEFSRKDLPVQQLVIYFLQSK